jgi:hypothetical protein
MRPHAVLRRTGCAAILLCSASPAAPAPADALDPVCRGPDPYEIVLVPTAHANGATGRAALRFAPSPFGVTVSPDGHHLYEMRLETAGLRADGRALVVWAATPELDRVSRLGTLDANGTLDGTLAFNKFLVFVTAEESPDVERWAGPILLRGISPSGRMHTMAGHGPFQGEPCSKWGFGPTGSP